MTGAIHTAIAATLMTSTSAASALHGGNWVSKPYLIAAHAVACMASLPLMGTAWYWAPAGLLPSAIFWLLYRTSRQARAELTAIRLPSARTFMRCAISYAVPLAVTSALCTTLFAYAGAWTWLWSVAALWLTMAAPYLAVRTFNHSTRIGRKLRAREIASMPGAAIPTASSTAAAALNSSPALRHAAPPSR